MPQYDQLNSVPILEISTLVLYETGFYYKSLLFNQTKV